MLEIYVSFIFTYRMKERKKQKLARIETQLDDHNNSIDDTQEQEEATKQTLADETITKLSQLEKTYEERKKVKKT